MSYELGGFFMSITAFARSLNALACVNKAAETKN